jgi:uncharacterized protein YndB with AHSA1/START domain
MSTTTKYKIITVEAVINAPVEKVWKLWTDPKHIVRWNNASDDWHTPEAENDLRVGGKFRSRMEARDGSHGFDFTGEYSKVALFRQIAYSMPDGRKVLVSFVTDGNDTRVKERFDAEQTHPPEMQRSGWQAILDNFKKYAETSGDLKRIHFEIRINAKAEFVHKTMLDKEKYEIWTAEFNPTSHYIGSWEKGSKILFLGTDADENMGGMVSRIRENIIGRSVSIEHIGIVQHGREILSGSEVEGWAGAMENYSFSESNGKTLLSVSLDSNQEFMSYFQETWPRALKKLKEICEA